MKKSAVDVVTPLQDVWHGRVRLGKCGEKINRHLLSPLITLSDSAAAVTIERIACVCAGSDILDLCTYVCMVQTFDNGKLATSVPMNDCRYVYAGLPPSKP